MFLHNGFKFDRFGDEIEVSGGGVSETELDHKVKEVAIIVGGELKRFENNMSEIEGKLPKDVYEKDKKLVTAIAVTSDCIKIKGNQRICGVVAGKSLSDVVVLSQGVELYNKLVEFQEEVRKLFKQVKEAIEVVATTVNKNLETLAAALGVKFAGQPN